MSTRIHTANLNMIWNPLLRIFPSDIKERLSRLPLEVLGQIEEIRLRTGQPLHLLGSGIDDFLGIRSGLTKDPKLGFVVKDQDVGRVVQQVTQSSLYAVEEELRRGYVTMPGGHRVGLAGRAVLYESGAVRSLRSITSVNIRLARECVGAAKLLPRELLIRRDGRPHSVLIVSPPQCGKTTLLRDLTREWSEQGVRVNGTGLKITVVDERSEIAGCVDGVPQFRVGPKTDVLDACPKAEGMLMAIRSLSPDVVVTDEIGRKQDCDAILEATHAGVSVLASAHAQGVDDWRIRPFMQDLFGAKAFTRYVVLSRKKGPGTVEAVFDERGMALAGFTTGRAAQTSEP